MRPENHHDKTDAELLALYYRDQDNHWLGLLLQRYTLLLLGVCMKYLKQEEEARDSVQQLFLKVIQEMPRHRVEYFKSWLYMVAKNHCLMKLRERQGRGIAELTEQLIATPAEEENAEERLYREEDLHYLPEALEQLGPEQRQCVTLFYLQKKSYQEVSEATGYSLLQVKSYIQNGKRNLRILLEKHRARR